jgi:uncharacterized protein (DUF58 family)
MAAAANLRQRAEQAAALLPSLLVEAERIAQTVVQGVHGRRRVGTGDAFWQFRRYQPGDPAPAIDWRQSAKRQNYYIRQNEWEAAESVWLWRDNSPSMAWRSQFSSSEKIDRANLLLLAVAALLIRGGERVALLGGERIPSAGRAVLGRLTAALLAELPGGDAAPGLPPQIELPRFAQVVWIGDFLAPIGEIEQVARDYASRNVTGYLLQVIDPAEEDLPYGGRTRFLGLEGEAPILVARVETVRQQWRDLWRRRHADLTDLARKLGWHYSLHRTDRSPQAALLTLYAAMSGRRVR